MKPRMPRTISITLPVVIVLAFLTLYFTKQFSAPLDPSGGEEIVMVDKGRSVKEIGRLLEGRGIIKSRRAFSLMARLKGQTHNLKAGEYKLSSAMSLSEILYALKEGKVHYHKVTVPEGFTLVEIARALEKEGLATAQEFMAVATSQTVISGLEIEAESLEGYLFPETYYFTYDTSSREIVDTMIGGLEKNYESAFHLREKELSMSKHQILTLASIIEEEAKKEDERSLISGVFHNRLKRGMLLQADPTIRYAMGGFKGPIEAKMLKTPSPYNTYLHAGLPPGPISNPGLPSIRAALYPAPTSYLYFVALEDGTHKFSNTLKEHNRTVHSLREK